MVLRGKWAEPLSSKQELSSSLADGDDDLHDLFYDFSCCASANFSSLIGMNDTPSFITMIF